MIWTIVHVIYHIGLILCAFWGIMGAFLFLYFILMWRKGLL